jgi:hypothetical protein
MRKKRQPQKNHHQLQGGSLAMDREPGLSNLQGLEAPVWIHPDKQHSSHHSGSLWQGNQESDYQVNNIQTQNVAVSIRNKIS